MTESELIATGYYAGLALFFSIVVIAGLGLMLQIDRFIGRWVAFFVVPAMLLGTAVSSALSGRNLKYAFANIENLAEVGASSGTGVLRLITATVVGMCAATVIATLFRQGRAMPADPRQPAPAGQWLFATFCAFYLCNAVFNSAFGTVPSFVHGLLYLPVTFAAVYLWRNAPVDTFVGFIKWALVAFMLGSLALAAAAPALAIQSGYKSWVPGLSIRLWGLASNPNSLGPLALLLLLLEWMQPSSRQWLRWLTAGLGLLVLLMAQSKTAWAAGLAVLPVIAWYRFGRAPAGGMRIGFALSLIAGLLLLTGSLAFVDVGRAWDRIADTQIGTDVTTLTGRLQIWAAAIEAWRQSPVFGYGPTAWGAMHRFALGMPFAFSAHNQFLQSMSVAGTLGLLSLLAYLAVLGTYCWRAADATRGASAALFLFVLLRCLTEAPFAPGSLFTGDAVTHLLLFRIALIGAKPRPVPQAKRASWHAQFGEPTIHI